MLPLLTEVNATPTVVPEGVEVQIRFKPIFTQMLSLLTRHPNQHLRVLGNKFSGAIARRDAEEAYSRVITLTVPPPPVLRGTKYKVSFETQRPEQTLPSRDDLHDPRLFVIVWSAFNFESKVVY